MRVSKPLSFHISKLKLRLVTNETRGRVKSCPLSFVHDTGIQEKVLQKAGRKEKSKGAELCGIGM